MSVDVPRRPDHYHPSIHAGQQRKDRRIPWEKVADTLESGEVKPGAKPGTKLFIKDFGDEYPVGVVANPTCGTILTVEWRMVDN